MLYSLVCKTRIYHWDPCLFWVYNHTWQLTNKVLFFFIYFRSLEWGPGQCEIFLTCSPTFNVSTRTNKGGAREGCTGTIDQPLPYAFLHVSQGLVARYLSIKYRLWGILTRRIRMFMFPRLKTLRYLTSEPLYTVKLNLIVQNFVITPGNTHIRNSRPFLVLLVYRNV